MKFSRRGFLEAATLLALSGATRAQSQTVKMVELVPTIDIEGVKNSSARRLLQRAFDLPGRLWDPILSPTGKQLVCGNFFTGSADIYILSLVDDQIKVRKVSDPYVDSFESRAVIAERERKKFSFGSARAFSPDGKIYALGNYGSEISPIDDSIQLWDSATWRKIGVLKGHPHTVISIVFSRDGKKIISGNAGSGVIIYDVATRTIDAAWTRNPYASCEVNVVFWNDRGARVPLAIVRKRFSTENLSDSEMKQSQDSYIRPPENAVVAPETPLGDFEIWNIETNQKIKDLKLPDGATSLNQTIYFSADGRIMALLMASDAKLDAEETNGDSTRYRAVLVNWTNEQIDETSLISPPISDFGPFYITLRFVPHQNVVLLSNTPADSLGAFDVAALAQPQEMTH